MRIANSVDFLLETSVSVLYGQVKAISFSVWELCDVLAVLDSCQRPVSRRYTTMRLSLALMEREAKREREPKPSKEEGVRNGRGGGGGDTTHTPKRLNKKWRCRNWEVAARGSFASKKTRYRARLFMRSHLLLYYTALSPRVQRFSIRRPPCCLSLGK